MKKCLVTLLLLLPLLLAACNGTPKPKVVHEGETVPALTLIALDGGRLNLDSLHGKLVVLHIWATWCAPCREEMPGLDRLAQKLDGARFAVIGLSIDEDANLVREFKRRYNISFANHIDVDNLIAKPVFGITATPETFLITPDGKLLRHMIGAQSWDSPGMLQLLELAYSGQQGKSGAYW